MALAKLQTERAKAFKPEIQALRAIAVAMVVFYHLRPAYLPGGFLGVDVFFVISGFLITGHLVNEAVRTGRVSLKEFWAARARRILPASLLTIAVTVVAAVLILPIVWHLRIVKHALASTFYGQNWVLARAAVDYLAQNSVALPFQHYWSLSVEEQFYIVWPLIILAVYAWFRIRTKESPDASFDEDRLRKQLTWVLSIIILASFAYGVYIVNISPDLSGYFSTLTRLWELGAGGLLAVLIPHVRLGARVRAVLGVTSILCCAGMAFLMSANAQYPGALSVVPVAAALLGILAGPVTFAPLRHLVNLWVVQWIGNLSYSIYLWHFPVITLYTLSQHHRPSWPVSLGLVALTLGLSWLSFRFVENPVRLSPFLKVRPWWSLGILGLCLGLTAAICVTLYLPARSTEATWSSLAQTITPGPGAPFGAPYMAAGSTEVWVPGHTGAISPSPLQAETIQTLPGQSCAGGERTSDRPAICTYGPDDAGITIALVGDSNMRHFWEAFIPFADSHDVRIVAYHHNSCPFSYDTRYSENSTHCEQSNKTVAAEISALKPTLVVTTAFVDVTWKSQSSGVDQEAVPGTAGMSRLWDDLQDLGIRIMAIGTVPRQPDDFLGCVADNYSYPQSCATPRNTAILSREDEFWKAMETGNPDVTFFHPLTYMCNDTTCPVVLGNILVYMNSNHLTAEFARSLSDPISEALTEALEL